MTALMWASFGGHDGCVQALLRIEDADVNHKDDVSSTKAVRCLLLMWTIQKNCTIVDPLFPSFLHHNCLQILHVYTTNFLRENGFISCSILLFFLYVTTSIQVYMHVLCNPYILVQC